MLCWCKRKEKKMPAGACGFACVNNWKISNRWQWINAVELKLRPRKTVPIRCHHCPLVHAPSTENYEINFMVEKNLLFCASNAKPIKSTCFISLHVCVCVNLTEESVLIWIAFHCWWWWGWWWYALWENAHISVSFSARNNYSKWNGKKLDRIHLIYVYQITLWRLASSIFMG